MADERKTRPYRPSNGTEGDDFQEIWCARCVKDAAMRNNPGEWEDGCPIIAMTMIFNIGEPEYPPEWIEDDVDSLDSNPRCTAFEEVAHAD